MTSIRVSQGYQVFSSKAGVCVAAGSLSHVKGKAFKARECIYFIQILQGYQNFLQGSVSLSPGQNTCSQVLCHTLRLRRLMCDFLARVALSDFFRILEFFRMVFIQPESRPAKGFMTGGEKALEIGKVSSCMQKNLVSQGYVTPFGILLVQEVSQNIILFLSTKVLFVV